MAAQLPVPNIANIQFAVNGMTAQGNSIAQGVQAYIAHQQALNTDLSRCDNYNVVQIQQQLTAIQQSIAESSALNSAEHWNLNALMQNMKVNHAARHLVVMRSVDPSPNPQVPINQAIPNFPATPGDLSQMTVAQLRDILTALDTPIPQGAQGAQPLTRELETAVREAIGLPAL